VENGKGKRCCLLLVISLFFILAGCASSNVSRDAAANVDLGVQNAKNLTSGAGDTNIADSYQNSTQATKGVFLGGAVGGVAGALSSGIGFIPGAAAGAILGASYGGYIETNETLADRLQNRGATIVVLGDQILIVLPSSRIFNPWSDKIKPQAYSTLKMVTQYINGYTKMLVNVAVYTDKTGSGTIDLSLSQQQADSVVKFLTESGIDARVLYAIGNGGTKLVAPNTGNWESDNYRIEITLEKLYV
jgi:outer membrane protein OmpA-like peptidoglycan-associated protein